MTDTRELSLWWDQLTDERPDELVARPPLDGDTTADVVVVGGGLTGLWTAYYLLEADPALDVLVVEREVAAFGASGRNGGWCSALFPQSASALAARHGRDAALAMRAAMRDTVVEVGGVAAAEGIDCGFAYGGTVTLARSRPQLERISAEAADAAAWGDEVHLLDAHGTDDHVRAAGVLGGTWTPDCARVQPVALARGLARAVEARGGRIAEGTAARRLSPRAVVTDRGTVRAPFVVRATEAWTGRRRSPTGVTSSCTACGPRTTGWPSVAAARRTTWARPSTRPSTAWSGCTSTCAVSWSGCSRCSPTPR